MRIAKVIITKSDPPLSPSVAYCSENISCVKRVNSISDGGTWVKDMLPSPKLGVRSLTLGCSCRGSVSQGAPVQEECTPLMSCSTEREDRVSLHDC